MRSCFFFFFFFNDTATSEIYTLSLHDALPILAAGGGAAGLVTPGDAPAGLADLHSGDRRQGPAAPERQHAERSEEHTSELQSRLHLVCRLLLEKKKKKKPQTPPQTLQQTNTIT